MIYPFRAKATDELIMLSQHARSLLGMLAKTNGKKWRWLGIPAQTSTRGQPQT